MCDFFSGILMRNGKVLADGNSNSHEDLIKQHKLDDKLPVDDVKRNWIRFELKPKEFYNCDINSWIFRVDESSSPKWLNDRHEHTAREYVVKHYLNQKWYKRVCAEITFVKSIKWFTPMDEPDLKLLDKTAQEVGAAFKIKGKMKIKLIPLSGDAAWAAAGDAGFEIGSDKIKKYKTNPFKLLVRLWSKGFYVCGIVNKTLTLGYVPKEKKRDEVRHG